MTHSQSPKSRARRSPDAQAKSSLATGAKKRPLAKNRRAGKSESPRDRRSSKRPDKRASDAPSTDKLHLPMYREARGKSSARSEPSCTACGLCCSYVAVEVDTPATVKQATQLLWYVYHEGVSLYVNEDEWMVQFDTTCIHLQPDYRCGVYETRPHICREFSEQDCEINTGDDGKTFYTATEFLAHLKDTRPRIYNFVSKRFAPPTEPARTRLAPFEHRFQAVLSRRKALGI
jgi:Fe-S-cluster containining protein